MPILVLDMRNATTIVGPDDSLLRMIFECHAREMDKKHKKAVTSTGGHFPFLDRFSIFVLRALALNFIATCYKTLKNAQEISGKVTQHTNV